MAHEAHDYYGDDNNNDNNPAGDGHGEDEEEFFDPEGPMDEEEAGDLGEGEDDDENGEAGGMRALVRTLRDIARQAGFDPDHAVQLNKLRIVLEAVGGDLDLDRRRFRLSL